MACAMFFAAIGVQFAVRKWSVARISATSALATILSMTCLMLVIHAALVPALIAPALLAGAGQGLGQMGGLTLIGLHVPDTRRAQANTVLNIGGYIPAGLPPPAAGYLIDRTRLAAAGPSFALVLAATAPAGGAWAMRRAEQPNA